MPLIHLVKQELEITTHSFINHQQRNKCSLISCTYEYVAEITNQNYAMLTVWTLD